MTSLMAPKWNKNAKERDGSDSEKKAEWQKSRRHWEC